MSSQSVCEIGPRDWIHERLLVLGSPNLVQHDTNITALIFLIP